MQLPNAPQDITVEWLNLALAPRLAGAAVTEVVADYHPTPGQTADVIAVEVTYDRPCELPRRLVAKVTAALETTRALAEDFDFYRREVAFYQAFGDAGFPIPDCLFAGFAADGYRCALLLEDLSPAVSPSWGVTTSQCEAAVELVGPLHARHWNDPGIREHDWLIAQGDDAFFGALRDSGRTSMNVAVDFGLPPLAQQVIETWYERLPRFLEFVRDRSFTVVHGDYHPKQMFFPVDGAGRFAIIDWQFPMIAPGPWDLARLITLSLSTDDRRRLQPKLFDAYLASLKAHGVEGYGRDDLLQDFLCGQVINLSIHVAACATDISLFEKEVAGYGKDAQDILFGRLDTLFGEHDVLALVESL